MALKQKKLILFFLLLMNFFCLKVFSNDKCINLYPFYENNKEIIDSNSEIVIQECKKAVENFPNEVKYKIYLARNLHIKNSNFEEAYKWYKIAADLGDDEAITEIGYFLKLGLNNKKDYELAFKYFLKAANLKNVRAMHALSDAYKDGIGTKKNDVLAFQWLKKAAELGFERAVVNLGYFYGTGLGTKLNYIEALKWYKKASNNGSALAEFNIGTYYHYGHGVKKDYQKAYEWYSKAAKKEHVSAFYNLGMLFYNGNFGKINGQNDYKSSLEYFNKCSTLKDSTCDNMIAIFYELGLGVKQDKKKAFKWYLKAAENGNAEGSRNVGDFYGLGILNGEKNYVKAKEWYLKAHKLKDAQATYKLGYLYSLGLGVEKDVNKAFEYYKIASKAGEVRATYNIGVLYGTGAFENGPDYFKAVEWYTKASKENYPAAIYNLGLYYELGIGGLPKDLSVAVSNYLKAAQLNDVYAQIKLAEMYIKYPQYEVDSPLSWLKKARENPEIDDKQLEIVESYLLSIDLDEDIKVLENTTGIDVNTETSQTNTVKFESTSRLAILIANESYAKSPLTNPINDVNLLSKTLEKKGFKVMIKKNLNYKKFINSLNEFRNLISAEKKDTTVLFYYAGHGLQYDGKNYLIPINSNINNHLDFEIEAIDLQRVFSTLYATGGVKIVLLDACRNNPYKSFIRSSNRGLAQVSTPTGTIIGFSTAPGKIAEDGFGENSPYAIALNKAVQIPNLKIEEVLKQTRISVMRQTTNNQIPWDSSSLTKEFYFSNN